MMGEMEKKNETEYPSYPLSTLNTQQKFSFNSAHFCYVSLWI